MTAFGISSRPPAKDACGWEAGRRSAVNENRKLVVNEADAKTVRSIFRRFVTLGSATALARELQEEERPEPLWAASR